MTTIKPLSLKIHVRRIFGRVDYVPLNDDAKKFVNHNGIIPACIIDRLKLAGADIEEVS